MDIASSRKKLSFKWARCPPPRLVGGIVISTTARRWQPVRVSSGNCIGAAGSAVLLYEQHCFWQRVSFFHWTGRVEHLVKSCSAVDEQTAIAEKQAGQALLLQGTWGAIGQQHPSILVQGLSQQKTQSSP